LTVAVVILVVKNESKSSESDWNHSLDVCLAEAENFQPPSEIFAVR